MLIRPLQTAALALGLAGAAAGAQITGAPMNILIESRGASPIRVQLADNPTARDFYAQLPLTLQAEDYANTEKIARLSHRLTTKDAPAGHAGKRGDFTYYAPWGNLAIFYKDYRGGTAAGLVYLGRITEGLDALDKLPAGEIRIRAQ